MNAKKARLIRQTMKQHMSDWNERAYDLPKFHVKQFFDGKGIRSYNVVNPIRLDAFCGRAKYKELKQRMSAAA